MMRVNQWLVIAGVAVSLCAGANNLIAQDAPPQAGPGGPGGRQNRGGGNFDPEQMRARMMERYKEQLEVTSDDEWKVIQPRIQKVTEARMAVGFGGMGRGMFGGRGGGRPGADNAAAPAGGGGGQRPGFGGQSNPELEALQKAIESKASNAELKAAMEKYAAARKEKQAELEKAQAELRKVLSVRQEAIAITSGLF